MLLGWAVGPHFALALAVAVVLGERVAVFGLDLALATAVDVLADVPGHHAAQVELGERAGCVLHPYHLPNRKHTCGFLKVAVISLLHVLHTRRLITLHFKQYTVSVQLQLFRITQGLANTFQKPHL